MKKIVTEWQNCGQEAINSQKYNIILTPNGRKVLELNQPETGEASKRWIEEITEFIEITVERNAI
jgi:hypothetical protein